jgi:hypothetical protein
VSDGVLTPACGAGCAFAEGEPKTYDAAAKATTAATAIVPV